MNGPTKSPIAVAVGVSLLAIAPSAWAQLQGDLVKGQEGLAAGTQPPEGLVLSAFAYDSYNSQVVGRDGNDLHTQGSLNILAIPGVNVWYVSPLKILDANYGAVLSLWGTESRVDAPRLQTNQSSGYGFGDMYLKPLELGWHTPHVDAIAGFALWIPTGRYTPGGNDNTGQGQWGYEFSAGATVWLEKSHHFNLSTQAFYDIYSPRRGSIGPNNAQLQTGNIFTLMGGLGYQLLDGGLNVGIPYFVQWKVTEDTLPQGFGVVLPAIQAAKDWSMGLGAEGDLFWSKTDGVTVRFVQSFAGVNTLNGQTYFLYYNHVFAFGGS